MRVLKKLIRKFDFFGEYFIFEIDKQSKFKSTFGGLASIISVISISVLSLFFCKDIYLRANPTSSTTQEILLQSVVQFKTIFPVLSFHSDNGIPIKDPLSYISFTINRIDISASSNNNFEEIQDYKPIYCDFDQIKKETHGDLFEVLKDNGIKYFCVNNYDNLFFKNGFTETDSSFIDIRFSPCDETKRKCADDMNKVLSNRYITARFINSYVDIRNYDSPVNHYLSVHTQKINTELKTETYLRFTSNILQSSDGILL
jgi:hypothetical protein